MNRYAVVGAAFVTLALPASAPGQVAPDAGRILEDARRASPPPPPSPQPQIEHREPERPAFSAPEGFRVSVKAFRFTRNSVFTESQLAPLVASFVGRELDLADIEQAAAVISRYYRQRGYFVARAYVPAQEIRDGVVEITVLEGRIGAISTDRKEAARLADDVIQKTLASRQASGSVIEQRHIERGLLLLNDLPGVLAQSYLVPGAELGTSDLRVAVSEGPLLSGSVDADTYGNRYTGRIRIGATAYLNDPSGRGDQGTLRAGHAEGLDYARIAYGMPLAYDGLRGTAALTGVRYKLCCDFAALGARGSANEASLALSYPFMRSRLVNVYGSLTGAHKWLRNETVAGTTSDKRITEASAAASFEAADSTLTGGATTGSLSLTSGTLNLDPWAPDRAADAATAQAHGSFSRLNYGLARTQPIATKVSLSVALTGQKASKNLDSSEQFALGGPNGVRGYPTGEGIGDEGALLQAELAWQAAPRWQVSAFYDYGRIRTHRYEWLGWQGANPSLLNVYSLSSVGLGLSWSEPRDLALRLAIARKIGTNPARSLAGTDSDNRNDRVRLWAQGVKYF